MLLVRTPRAGRGGDMREIWFAHIRDQERPVQAVAAIAGAPQDAKVIVFGTIRHAVMVDQLGVPEGEVKSFDDRRPYE
jgi:hypothetical protein